MLNTLEHDAKKYSVSTTFAVKRISESWQQLSKSSKWAFPIYMRAEHPALNPDSAPSSPLYVASTTPATTPTPTHVTTPEDSGKKRKVEVPTMTLSDPNASKRKLLVSNIAKNVTEENLMNIFQRFGNVLSIEMNEGRALIKFNEEISALKAQQQMDGVSIEHCNIGVSFAPKQTELKSSPSVSLDLEKAPPSLPPSSS
jgi:hypothetical protein